MLGLFLCFYCSYEFIATAREHILCIKTLFAFPKTIRKRPFIFISLLLLNISVFRSVLLFSVHHLYINHYGLHFKCTNDLL